MKGALPHRIKSIHEQYGEIVRVAPNEISFNTPAAWRDIYTSGFPRPYEFRGKPPGKDAENLISADEANHQRFRKALAPAFVVKEGHEALVKKHVNLLIQKFILAIKKDPSRETTSVDMVKWLNYTTFDIIGNLVWGSSFGCLDGLQYHPWIQVIDQYRSTLIMTATKFYYPLDKILRMITPKSALNDIMQIWKTTESKIAQRMERGSEQFDMISAMIGSQKSSDEPPKTSIQEMEVNAMLIVVAGSESVTTALTGIINYLLRNHTMLESLTQEVRSNFQRKEDLSNALLSRLPYLNAVLHEGLRLCPTIPDGMRRQVTKGGGMVAGQWLPQGTIVSVPQWATYQSSKNFESPSLFAPERWLQDCSDPSYGTDRKEAFQPFSLGPHNCPGQGLAWLEMRLLLATLVLEFDLGPPSNASLPDWTTQRIFWFWEKKATQVQLRRSNH